MLVFRRPEQHAARTVRSLARTTVFVAGLLSGGELASYAQTSALPTPPAAAPVQQTPAANPDDAPAPTGPSQTGPDQDADGLTSLGGLPSTQNNTLVDGASVTQTYTSVPVGRGTDEAPDPDEDADSAELTTGSAHGLARGRRSGAAYVFSPASIREFRVGTRDYSAQFGHAAGAVLASSTRSGTADLHGSVAFTLRSSISAAAEPLAYASTYAAGLVSSARVKPHDLRETYVGSLGGPLGPVRAHLFGFYTFDAQRRGFPAVSSPADPGFYALTPTQTALLANRGVTATATATALTYLASLTGETPRRADQTIHFGRVDWLRHPAFSPGLAYNRVRWNAPAGLVEAPVVARGRASLGSASGSIDQLLFRVASVLSSHLSNEVRVAWLRDLQYELPQTPLPQEPAIAPGGLAPEVNIGPNGLLFGTPAALSQQAYPDERRFELAEALTLTRRRHTLVFGGDAAFTRDRVATLPNAAGTFHYDSATANGKAGGLVDFITDYTFNAQTLPNEACPSIHAAIHLFCYQSYAQSFGANRTAFSTQDYAAFAEDTWHPAARLTLYVGARFEYTLLPLPAAPNAALDAVFSARGATSVFPEDRNNFGPRAGLALALPYGVVLHAGYGLYYGRLAGATIRQALAATALPTSTTSIRIRPSAEVACPQAPANNPNQGFGYACSFAAAPTGVAATATTSATVFARNFRLPAVQQASFSLERAFARGTMLGATYLLNLDRQLPGSADLNIAPSTVQASFVLQGGTEVAGVRTGETFALPLYTARLSPNFGPVTAITSRANGSYNALALSASSSPAPTLLLRAAYSWAKAIDDGPSLSGTPRTSTQLDPYANGYDKGLSSLNQVWTARVALTWEPGGPAQFGSSTAGRLLPGRLVRGLRLTPIFVAHAGRPYSFDLFGGSYLPGGHESLNGSGGALYLPTVGRNTLRLPATAVLNLRLARDFRSRARVQVHAAAEATNLLNRMQISSVNARAYLLGTPVAGVTPLVFQNAAALAAEGLNTTPFGTPTAASTDEARARQVQFNVAVTF